jgi:cation diffusion facilitator family transporter
MASHANSAKAIFFALGANLAIAITKYFAAFITHSGSMLAEAVHSTADCGNQLLLLLGMHQAKKPPSDDYPLGFGKETYFWSFIVALMLFSVGGMFSLYEGWHKLAHLSAVNYPFIALSVLGFSIIAESLSMWGCLKEVNKIRGNHSLWRWFRSSRNAELIVIFGEDFAALVGLLIAFIAVAVTWATHNPLYDAIGTIMIGILLLMVAIIIGIEVKAMLVGQGVEEQVKHEMVLFIQNQATVDKVYNMLTMQMGKDVMVAVKVQMKPAFSDIALIEAINTIEKLFRQQFPQVAFLFFEPDLRD